MMGLIRDEIFFEVSFHFFWKPLDIFDNFPYNSRPQTLIGLELRQEV